jgi:hypothetical protein
LQLQNLLADLLGLGFRGECDNDEITHGVALSFIRAADPPGHCVAAGRHADRATIFIGCVMNVNLNRQLTNCVIVK